MEAELEQLAGDALIAPARVLACEPQHQLAQRTVRRRTTGLALQVRPSPAHQRAMPTQQRRWRDHESVSAPVRKQSSQRSDERTIGRPKPRTRMLTSQNRELVPQQHQFHVFGELGSTTANEQPQNSSERKVSKGEEHRAILPGPANALTADSSCAVQRFLVFARARETPLMPETTSGAATEHPIRSTPSRIHREDAKAVRHSRIQARASNRSFD